MGRQRVLLRAGAPHRNAALCPGGFPGWTQAKGSSDCSQIGLLSGGLLFSGRSTSRSMSTSASAASSDATAASSSASSSKPRPTPSTDPRLAKVAMMRNFGISAHIDSGKTTLTERILFYTGRIKEIHDVRGKSGVGAKMDSMVLERERGITIQSAATFCNWGDNEFNIIDTPGHVDFQIEVERALRVLDGAVMICCAVGGVQAQTLTVHRQMTRYEVPRVVFVNKMDRNGADPFYVAKQIRQKLGLTVALVQVPIGAEDKFEGVIDVIHRRAVTFSGDQGQHREYSDDIPTALREKMEEVRTELIETLADLDDDFAAKYLEEGENAFSPSEIQSAVRKLTLERKFSPVFCGSAYKNKGVQELLDGVGMYLPSPLDRVNKGLDMGGGSKGEENNAEIEQAGGPRSVVLQPDFDAPLIGYGFKIQDSPQLGVLTYVRIYQGRLKKGMSIQDLRTGKKTTLKKLVKMHSNESREVPEAGPGDIVAVPGLECPSGTTLTDGRSKIACTSMHVPAPVMSLGVKSMNHDESVRFNKAAARFKREDPTFHLDTDPETKEQVLRGMGELHLEIYLERMLREFNCTNVQVGEPRVSYKECISQKTPFDYTYKRQSGGKGQYGKVMGYFEPIPEEDLIAKAAELAKSGELGAGGCAGGLLAGGGDSSISSLGDYVEFVNNLSGNDVPKNYHGSIEKGFLEACKKGFLSGHPLIHLRCVVTDGKAHECDSSDIAFQMAMRGAVRHCLDKGGPHILEPQMNVEVTVPREAQPAVLQGLSEREGTVQNTTPVGSDNVMLEVIVPLRQMFGYAKTLRSLTMGLGEFSMDFREYVEMPSHEQDRLISHYDETVRQHEVECF
ncbi:unnamed protein product [Amoebophrya sp. A25]|nr:unnamed protein product [Amoebophrya sp. A25]|eukprot:GSA25T00026396001.1